MPIYRSRLYYLKQKEMQSNFVPKNTRTIKQFHLLCEDNERRLTKKDENIPWMGPEKAKDNGKQIT